MSTWNTKGREGGKEGGMEGERDGERGREGGREMTTDLCMPYLHVFVCVIEIEHCALIENEDDLKQLRFLTSKEADKSSPLHFHPIEGTRGKFTQHRCYGRASLSEFSDYGIFGSKKRRTHSGSPP